MKKLLSGAGAALAAKIVTGFAVAAIASTAAVAATEIALTGSANPANWGQQVKQTVATCKETLRASGTRGIGQCVSAFANQHGKTESAGHSDGAGNASGNGKAKGNKGKHLGQGNGHGNSQAGNKPDTTSEVESGD
jgi:hypothetical protein